MQALLGGVVDGVDDDRLGNVPGVGREAERGGLRGGRRRSRELPRTNDEIDEHIRGGTLPEGEEIGIVDPRLAHRRRSAWLDDHRAGAGRILDRGEFGIEVEMDLPHTGLVPAAEVEV